MSGFVELYEGERCLFRGSNLIVNTALPAMAHLLGGDTSGQFISLCGFGTSSTAPTLTDTNLNGPPFYYNDIQSVSYPQSGSVQFNYGLSLTDYGAVGMDIQELGLFANSAGISVPSLASASLASWVASTQEPVGTMITDSNGNTQRSTTPPSWTASTTEATGNLIIDSNGNLQKCTTAGETGTSIPTNWATTVGGTTTDNTVTWTLEALKGYTPETGTVEPTWPTVYGGVVYDNLVMWTMVAYHAIPSPLYSHVNVPSFNFSGAAVLSGTWTLTF